MKRLLIIPIIAILTSSCAPNPVVVEVKDHKDQYLDCQRLSSAIRSAERFKAQARSEDRFRFRYMFIPTAVIAMYRFNKAEGAATKRIEHLKELENHRHCHANHQLPNQRVINPQMLNYPQDNKPQSNYYNNYQYNPQYLTGMQPPPHGYGTNYQSQHRHNAPAVSGGGYDTTNKSQYNEYYFDPDGNMAPHPYNPQNQKQYMNR